MVEWSIITRMTVWTCVGWHRQVGHCDPFKWEAVLTGKKVMNEEVKGGCWPPHEVILSCLPSFTSSHDGTGWVLVTDLLDNGWMELHKKKNLSCRLRSVIWDVCTWNVFTVCCFIMSVHLSPVRICWSQYCRVCWIRLHSSLLHPGRLWHQKHSTGQLNPQGKTNTHTHILNWSALRFSNTSVFYR